MGIHVKTQFPRRRGKPCGGRGGAHVHAGCSDVAVAGRVSAEDWNGVCAYRMAKDAFERWWEWTEKRAQYVNNPSSFPDAVPLSPDSGAIAPRQMRRSAWPTGRAAMTRARML